MSGTGITSKMVNDWKDKGLDGGRVKVLYDGASEWE